MKAALYDTHGPAAEVLRVEEVERPEPGPGEVRVKVAVSAVNPTDYKSRSGATPRPIDGFQIPHHDGAGVIDAVGDGVDPARVGQRVWLWLAAAGRRWGTAAEWTVVPGRQAVPLPDGASFELGASLGRSGDDRPPLPVRGRPGDRPDGAGRRRGGRGRPFRHPARPLGRRPGDHHRQRPGKGGAGPAGGRGARGELPRPGRGEPDQGGGASGWTGWWRSRSAPTWPWTWPWPARAR